MPMIGLGTYKIEKNDLKGIVKSAILDHGYRLIDTASEYKNEEILGEAIKECLA